MQCRTAAAARNSWVSAKPAISSYKAANMFSVFTWRPGCSSPGAGTVDTTVSESSQLC
jgi:hypothetical protein